MLLAFSECCISECWLIYRTSYATAMGSGISASSIDKLAEEEIKQVWDFLKERLFEAKQAKLIA